MVFGFICWLGEKKGAQIIVSSDSLGPFFEHPVQHCLTLYFSGGFKQYDHGVKTNLKVYNNKNPPSYNLSNVKVPLAYFYATEDPYSNVKVGKC